MNKNITLALSALLGLGFSAQVLAAPPQPIGPRPTEAQLARIRANQPATKRALTPEQKQMRQLTAQLRAELKKKPVDHARVNDLIRQIDAQREAMQIKQMETMMDNPRVSAKQKQRFSEMIQRAKARQAQQQQPAQPPANQ